MDIDENFDFKKLLGKFGEKMDDIIFDDSKVGQKIGSFMASLKK
jgi:hypothetical protein